MASVIRGDDNFDSSSVGPSTSYGAVGTYIFGYYDKVSHSATVNAGDTMAGSVIYPSSLLSTGDALSGSYGYGTAPNYTHRTASAVSGTWRVMGPNITVASNTRDTCTVMVRIS